MACAIEYQLVLPNQSFMQEDSLILESSWLQTEIYNDLELPAAYPELLTSSSAATVDPPSYSPPLFAQPQYKPKASSSVSATARAPAWWESPLADNIHKTLRKKECNLAKLTFKSPQLNYRAEIVDFLTSVCKHLDISVGTRHSAIRLMDYFMDGHNVMYYRLRLMSLTCLLIAAKFEEPDDCLPTIDMLQYVVQLQDSTNSYSRNEFQALELYILKYFKWNISHPGTVHFINYYVQISMEDACQDLSQWERNMLESQVLEFSNYFMESALRDQSFLHYKPSEVAAAIVCVARICSRMGTAWSSKLQEITCYSLEDLQPLASILLRLQEGFEGIQT